MDKDNKKIKAEDIVKVKESFMAKFPEVAVGFSDLKKQGKVCIEARVSNEVEVDKIPTEFEGYTVNTRVVSVSRLKKLLDIARGVIGKDDQS